MGFQMKSEGWHPKHSMGLFANWEWSENNLAKDLEIMGHQSIGVISVLPDQANGKEPVEHCEQSK